MDSLRTLAIGLAKRLRNSTSEPSRLGRTKESIAWYSSKLFCIGVPVSMTLRRVRCQGKGLVSIGQMRVGPDPIGSVEGCVV